MSEYAWFADGNGRSVYRKVPDAAPARSSMPCPMLIRDTIEPVRSMADGRMYDSMKSLRRTYRADGNPQGQEYHEVGNEPMRGRQPLKRASKQQLSDMLDQYDAKVARGEPILPAKAVDV